MSEVLHAEALATEENSGLSRRRVVAGVAWSLPVIVTAVAAPAAASASGVSAAVSFVGSATTFYKAGGGGGGTERTGAGPTGFQIQNSGGAITGAISGTINITPEGTVTAGIGVQSISQASVSGPSYSATQASTGSFTYSSGIPAGGTASFPIQFQYAATNGIPNKVTYSYVMTMTVTLPDGSSQVLPGVRLSVTF
ncbi:hypothetical protein ACFUTU_17015 [Arthrobacter sp. NPDC057388]|uniref:hypothetical protein n=1 Tax=Arthrobacter sp. NPDC057388 TaxID=3346116 RepID=UPI003624D87A